MKRLVVATQRIDPEHPALAATVPKLAALAERVEELTVLCDTAVPGAVPAGVRATAFAGPSRLERGLRFEAALAGSLRRGRAPVLAHMVPLYAILAAPLTRPLGSALLLWYTHWNATRELRLATRLASGVLSVDAASFPLETDKLHAIGHGIDVDRFDVARVAGPRLRLVALGRMSPMKRYPTLLRAVRTALDEGVDLELEIRGPALTDEERAHRAAVERLVRELRLSERVTVGDPLPWAAVPAALGGADVLVNLAEAADKIVYEGAAARTLVLASAPAFEALLPVELRFGRNDAASLSGRIVALAALAPASRSQLGEELRRRVVASHSVASWADAVVRIAARHDR